MLNSIDVIVGMKVQIEYSTFKLMLKFSLTLVSTSEVKAIVENVQNQISNIGKRKQFFLDEKLTKFEGNR